MPYRVEYTAEARKELLELRRYDSVAILDAVERHLLAEPTRESRTGIKKLDPPVIAPYRLRVGDYRVFYNVDELTMTVVVQAIRYKGRQSLQEAAHGPNN